MTSSAFISSRVEALTVKLSFSDAFTGVKEVKDLHGNLKFRHCATGRLENLGRVYDISDAYGQVIYTVESTELTSYDKRFHHGGRVLATSHGYVAKMRLNSPQFAGKTLHMATFSFGQF